MRAKQEIPPPSSQSMKPTQHFAVSFGSMRNRILKVLGAYLFLIRPHPSAFKEQTEIGHDQ
jgi:hypothetical protein